MKANQCLPNFMVELKKSHDYKNERPCLDHDRYDDASYTRTGKFGDVLQCSSLLSTQWQLTAMCNYSA